MSGLIPLALSYGLCQRCILRLQAEMNVEAYINQPGSSCSVCLGILNCEIHHQNIIQQVLTSGYEFEFFRINLSLPPATIFRESWIRARLMQDGLTIPEIYPDIKEIFKWLTGPVFNQNFGKIFSNDSSFYINIDFSAKEADAELEDLQEFIPGLYQKQGAKKKRIYALSSNALTKGLKEMSGDRVLSMKDGLSQAQAEVTIGISHAPMYVTGNYIKLARNISQSPWTVDTEHTQISSSIEDIIGQPLKQIFEAQQAVLHASGREDVDVRMLGNGRPFLIELKEPKKALSWPEDLESLLNTQMYGVQVKNVNKADVSAYQVMHQETESKLKAYAAVIWLSESITEEGLRLLNTDETIVLEQKTPIRVLHRRSLMARLKKILRMRAYRINDHFLVLKIITSSGTYVKEFVNGDLGRTQPNIGSIIGCRADILQLDVLGLGWEVQELVELLEEQVINQFKISEDLHKMRQCNNHLTYHLKCCAFIPTDNTGNMVQLTDCLLFLAFFIDTSTTSFKCKTST